MKKPETRAGNRRPGITHSPGASLLRVERKLLNAPFQEFCKVNRVFRRARHCMRPTNFRGLLTRPPESAQDLAIQVHIVDPDARGR